MVYKDDLFEASATQGLSDGCGFFTLPHTILCMPLFLPYLKQRLQELLTNILPDQGPKEIHEIVVCQHV